MAMGLEHGSLIRSFGGDPEGSQCIRPGGQESERPNMVAVRVAYHVESNNILERDLQSLTVSG